MPKPGSKPAPPSAPRTPEANQPSQSSPSPPRSARRSRWGLRLGLLAIGLAALTLFAPQIVVSSGLWKSVLAAAAPQLASRIEIKALRLGWFSPVSVEGVAVRDAANQPLASIPLVRSEKTLFDLIMNSRSLGAFHIQDPQVRIVLRADGSNVEDFIKLLPPSKSSGPTPGFRLALSRGTIEYDDQIAGRRWNVEGVALDLDAPATGPAGGKLTAAVHAAGAAGEAGQLAIDFGWPAGGAGPAGEGLVQLALQQVPTELAEGALRRLGSDVRPAGPLSMNAAVAWNAAGKSQRVVVSHLATPQLVVAAPALWGSDRPSVRIASGRGELHLEAGHVALRSLELDSSLVRLTAQGTAGAAAPSAAAGPTPGGTPPAAAAPSDGGQAAAAAGTAAQLTLDGELNLVELARQLPATLQLRPGTEIQSGAVQIQLSAARSPGSDQLDLHLRTTPIAAVAQGRPLRLDEALDVEASLEQRGGALALKRLAGRASFLELNGQGTLAAGSIRARASLDRLAQELGQLIDWGQLRLAGNLEAAVDWNQVPGDRWQASGQATIAALELAAPGLAPWKEPQLTLQAALEGVLRDGALAEIDRGSLTLSAGNDRLEAVLAAAVRSPSFASAWPVRIGMAGDLATWAPRLQPLVPLGAWRPAGAVRVEASGTFAAAKAEVASAKIELADLRISGPGVLIREPVVKVDTSGVWDSAGATLALGPTTLASSAIALGTEGVRVGLGSPPSLVGTIDLRGDLARLWSWRAVEAAAPGPHVAGGLTGRLEVGYQGQALAARWTADLEKLALLAPASAPGPAVRGALAASSSRPQYATVWEEPRIALAGQGAFDPVAASLAVERFTLATVHTSLAVSGTVQKLTTVPEVDLSGEISYDLAHVTQQIKALAARQARTPDRLPYGLDTLELAGKEKRPLALKGPLWAVADGLTPAGASGATAGRSPPIVSSALAGQASLAWQGAQYVGLVAGPAEFPARLADGILRLGPLDIPLSEGRLTTAPRLLLSEASPSVVIDRGPLIQNVRISPEMCSLWLKYVAPLVAEATRAEGTFSLALEGAAIPVAAPLAGDIAGTLAIHSAQVGPGPLAQQYVEMARQLRTLFDPSAGAATAVDPSRGWLVLPEQNVAFEVKDGAVHHRGLKMTIKDVVITTEGSVAIESQEISLLASIPLQDSWFKKQGGLLANLKGQTVQIPIRGTLTQPRLDGRMLENLTRQFAGSAAQGVIEKQIERGQGILQRELGKGLDKLFGPLAPAPAAPTTPPPATAPPGPRP